MPRSKVVENRRKGKVYIQNAAAIAAVTTYDIKTAIGIAVNYILVTVSVASTIQLYVRNIDDDTVSWTTAEALAANVPSKFWDLNIEQIKVTPSIAGTISIHASG